MASASVPLFPSLVFVKCQNVENLNELVDSVVPEHETRDGSKLWNINTKYYTADVKLVLASESELDDVSTENQIDGMVIYYNGNFDESSQQLKSVLGKLNNDDVGVKLLVCDECSSDSSRTNAVTWCLEESYEHLELSGPEGDRDRLRQALEANTWSNLVPKHTKKSKKPKGGQNAESAPADELDDFAALFGQLATIKEQTSCLSTDERKKFAEQVVLAYWKSIGGDEEELLDL
ncbi:alpha- and gamma-adaptin Hypothetical protein protein [Nesidiocoris tenuis]|uniref:Alpha-and gamma-adaptin-binding protein p34 n=1 Tax=Nesidiocoris tenuis TaxID=355587 RepID=A0ABN7BBG1_9HEMI|nr:alpha- and gamma-adaptin Hypothetical protein protein [Nesidiocoris tenuis]